MPVINPDEILSVLFRRLNQDVVFSGMVQSIDKGPKRRNAYANPAATVHILTMPIDAELDSYRSTVVVNVYMDDLATGQMDAQGLGQRAARVQYLFHKAHLPTHPEGPLVRPGLQFHTVYVQEPLFLPSDQENEHFASVRISVIVEAKE